MSPVPSLDRTPELLAPAGDLTCVRAAIENGADAVYFGLQDGFNARARAENLSLENLAEVMAMLRHRNVRGYVTLNTLVFSEELASFERIVRRVAEAGVDAVLVQDLGIVRLIRQVCPDLPIHASTQMTLTNAEAINRVAELGIDRVVLARELSLDEIQQIAQSTSVPLEVFVHGALCVAYSGQCLTSESLGGRSANRGHCAQACRLPYELVCDGQDVDLGPVRYLLSPQDLAGYELIPALWSAGVTAFKIEGRLKTPEYVANITRQYRAVIDAVVAGLPVPLGAEQIEEMELSFSRGFSPGWINGCDHKQLVPGLSSAKRGVLLGHVVSVGKRRVAVRLQRSLRAGDGIVFEGDRASGQEQGGRVFQVWQNGQPRRDRISEGVVELSFLEGSVDLSTIRPGCALWKTDDPELTRRLRRSYEVADPVRRRRLDIAVEAAEGKPLVVETSLPPYGSMRICSDEVLQQARKHPLTESFLREQLGRLGSTPYELGTVTAKIEGRPMIPLSVLGKLRRRWIEELDRMATAAPRRQVAAETVLPALRPAVPAADSQGNWTLTVLCRSCVQLQQVLDAGINEVIVDFDDIRQYASAVATAREADARIWLATPRICKPGETGVFRAMARHQPSGILARNLAAIDFFRTADLPVLADYSLNVGNEISARYLHELGVHRMTASYDLNRDQILALVRAVPREWLEVVIHQHMPMFHMEHCVFCAVLSPGTNKTNCGRPCDRHQVRLRDRVGMEHPLTADVGCRNTLFNARPQSAAEVVPLLRDAGIQSFRIELLVDQPESMTRRIIELYRQLLAGQRSGKEVWSQLQAANRLGVTRGTLEERRDPLAIL